MNAPSDESLDPSLARREFLAGVIAAGLSARCDWFVTLRPRLPTPTPGPFHIVVLGDSFAWQPGLAMGEKSCALVRKYCLSRASDQQLASSMRVFARSGAVIGEPAAAKEHRPSGDAAPWPGDVTDAFWDDPHPGGERRPAAPSVWQQLARATNSSGRGYVDPQVVSLVLVTAGSSDVAIPNIVAPRAPTEHGSFRQWIGARCGDRMRGLLPAIADAFPTAKILVTGFPQIVSEQTDAMELGRYLGALGVTAAGSVVESGGVLPREALRALATAAVKAASARQSALFAEESCKVLRDAVDHANGNHASRRVGFIDVRSRWTARNAYGAPESFFWHFTAPGEPPDNTAHARNAVCKTHTTVAGMPLDIMCVQAAMGHPNVAGARAYADAIIARLERSEGSH